MANVSSSNGLEKHPKLRFPGFDEPWKATAFGDIVHEFSNRTKVEDEDVLLSAAIEGMFLNTELFGHQRGASNKGYKKIKYGTMVLSTQNLHLGNANVNQRFEHGMVSPAYKTYDISGCSIDLIAQWIKSDAAKRFFYNATTVGASLCRRNVEWDTLYEQSLFLPSLPEQEKIANLLTLLSNRIEKQRQVIIALKKYKRGAVAHILSSKSVAFAVTSSWTEHTLSELCSEFRSGRNISATLIHQTGNFPVYGGNGIRGYCNQYSHDGEYVVVGRQGALCGNVRLIQGKNYLSEHAIAVQANEANETKFLLYLLDYMKLGQYSDQGAQPGLAVNRLLRLKCMVPDKQTQIKIASFLMSFDFQISTQERMLMLLNCQRRALLQQLFI